MPDELRNCGCNNNNGILGGLFNGCCSQDTEILLFLIIFLLLFTSFGTGRGL